MESKIISGEEAESLHPDRGAASNDSKIIQQMSALQSDVALQQAVQEGITKNSQMIAELQRTHKGLDFSGAFKDLQNDQVALQILSDKTYMQRMLQGESVQYQRVSLDREGRPIRNFGTGLISLDRRIDSLVPVVSLDYSAQNALNSQIRLTMPDQEERKFRFDLNVTESTVTAAFRRATNTTLRPDEQDELRIHSGNNDLVKTLRMLDAWYRIVPEEKKDQFKNDIATAAYVNLEAPVKTRNGGELSRRNEVPLLDLPLEIKGVKLNDKQILNLAKGLPVAVSGLKDSRIKEPYNAILSLNILLGKVQEKPREEVNSVNKGAKQKVLDGNESSPLTRTVANSPNEEESAETRKVRQKRLPRH